MYLYSGETEYRDYRNEYEQKSNGDRYDILTILLAFNLRIYMCMYIMTNTATPQAEFISRIIAKWCHENGMPV
jgi:hypothetical protein